MYFSAAYEWPLRVCSIFKTNTPADCSTSLGTVKYLVFKSECRTKQTFPFAGNRCFLARLFFYQSWLINITCRERRSHWDYLYLISNYYKAARGPMRHLGQGTGEGEQSGPCQTLETLLYAITIQKPLQWKEFIQ